MELPPNSPVPPQGLGYYQSGVVSNRPPSIMVISIFAIVLGALTVLCDGFGSLSALLMMIFSNATVMAHQNEFQTMPMKIVGLLQAVIGLALGGVLLAGGIGGVQLRAWARKLLIQWATTNIAFQLLTGALGLYFAFAVTMPAVQQQVNRQGKPMPAGMMTFVSAGSVVGVVIAAVVLCILPICVLIFWRRPRVIEAFEATKPSFG